MNDEQNPFALSASTLGYNDETLFDKAFDTLYSKGFENATPQEQVLLIGIAAGTIRCLRDHLFALEEQLNGSDKQL